MLCSDSNPRTGFTLVEAVVGIVLIAMFASSIFLAYRTHQTQLTDATETLAAVQFADNKIASLLRGKPRPASAASGMVPGHPAWRWSLAPVRTEPIAGTRAQICEFRVTRTGPAGRVLVRTEIVTHAQPPRSGGATL